MSLTGSDALLSLRRDLACRSLGLGSEFHATTDFQEIRDCVFGVIGKHDFRIDCTILEKAKAQPHLRTDDIRFYQTAWFYHLQHIAPKIVKSDHQLLVVAASMGTKKKRAAFRTAVADVVHQVSPTLYWNAASWHAHSDPCLQVADYCCWAIGRKWERGDSRSYDLIADKIETEFDLWRWGETRYY